MKVNIEDLQAVIDEINRLTVNPHGYKYLLNKSVYFSLLMIMNNRRDMEPVIHAKTKPEMLEKLNLFLRGIKTERA